MSERKEEELSPYAPGGRRAKMKKVSKSAMILVEQKNNQKRNADVNKDTKKRVRIDYAMRKIIQRRWNVNLDGKHESLRPNARPPCRPCILQHPSYDLAR